MGFFFTTITDDDMPDLAGLLVNSCAPVSTERRLALSAACDGGDISFDSGGERIQLSIDFTSIRTRQRRHWAPCLQRRAAKWAIGMFDIPERRAFMRWSHLARRNILPLHVGLFLSFFLCTSYDTRLGYRSEWRKEMINWTYLCLFFFVSL